MRYHLEQIEDQILATLQAEPTLARVNVCVHTGLISDELRKSEILQQECIANMPFVFLEYRGTQFVAHDEQRRLYVDEIHFRLYIGVSSLREKPESQRSAYAILRSVYDSLHGKVPCSDPQQLGTYPVLAGEPITTAGFSPQSALRKAPGLHESLVVNQSRFIIYATDYTIRLLA